MNTNARLVLAVALVVALAACGEADPTPSATGAPASAATSAPAATGSPTGAASPDSASPGTGSGEATPDGWQRVAVVEQGFSVAIPGEWEELSPDVIGDSGVMEEMLESNPDAAVAIEQGQAALESGQIALFAFDATDESIASGFATNLNAINVGPVEGTAQEAADEVAEAIAQQVPVVGEVQTTTVSLPAGEAARLVYEWPIEDADGETTLVTVTQYAIIADLSGDGFILSMSTASDRLDAYEEIFRQIAESFVEEPA